MSAAYSIHSVMEEWVILCCLGDKTSTANQLGSPLLPYYIGLDFLFKTGEVKFGG